MRGDVGGSDPASRYDSGVPRITMKKTGNRYDELGAFIAERHSQHTPEILTTPVTYGNEEYMRWISEETKA